MTTPLFPLNALVCPGGRLPLRIFEPRYLDMVKSCLRENKGFVVVMLKEPGPEVEVLETQAEASQAKASESDSSSNNRIYTVGTLVKIVDFDQGKDGILNIVTQGETRVDIKSAGKQSNGLWVGEVEPVEPESFVSLPDEFNELKSVLEALVQHPMVKDLNLDIDYQDGRQVGWRLTELLPFDNSQKQYLYELEDPIFRLEKISDQLDVMIA